MIKLFKIMNNNKIFKMIKKLLNTREAKVQMFLTKIII